MLERSFNLTDIYNQATPYQTTIKYKTWRDHLLLKLVAISIIVIVLVLIAVVLIHNSPT